MNINVVIKQAEHFEPKISSFYTSLYLCQSILFHYTFRNSASLYTSFSSPLSVSELWSQFFYFSTKYLLSTYSLPDLILLVNACDVVNNKRDKKYTKPS
jgi:hypothetical protein